jgi:hypothetical protein
VQPSGKEDVPVKTV